MEANTHEETLVNHYWSKDGVVSDSNRASLDESQSGKKEEEEVTEKLEKDAEEQSNIQKNLSPDLPEANPTDHDDHDVRHKLFTQSTHSFLFMDTIELPDGTDVKLRLFDKFAALVVIFFQIIAYVYIGFCILDAHTASFNDGLEPQLEISSDFCYKINQYSDPWEAYRAEEYDNKKVLFGSLAEAGITAEMLPKVLQCGNPVGEVKGIRNEEGLLRLDLVSNYTSVTAWILVFLFLLKDLYEVFVLFLCPGIMVKAAAILIFFLALLAQLTAGISVFLMDQNTALDTFSVSVGVIFVHEADEALRYVYDVFYATKRPGLGCAFVVFILCHLGLFYLILSLWLQPTLFPSESAIFE